MALPCYSRSSFCAVKRLKISSPAWTSPFRAGLSTTSHRENDEISKVLPDLPDQALPMMPVQSLKDVTASTNGEDEHVRLPRSVQAVYLKPLRRIAKHGVPCCDLQLRSYNIRNVDFFSDFALRAAYYLKLPARGPVPLPRITERWTVPRSNFVHKKSQENFERVTLRRLIQIQDSDPEVVEIWLAFLRKHAYYGVGMKANMYEHEKLGVGKTMDVSLENLKQVLEPKWAHFGRKKNLDTSEKVLDMLSSERFRHSADAPLSKI